MGGVRQEKQDLFSLGTAGRYVLSNRVELMVEYHPVIGARTTGTFDTFAIGANIETGGHIFQLFVSNTQWIVPQYAVSRTTTDISTDEFGFGFTVHRVF